MFDQQEYVRKLRALREFMPVSSWELSHEIGVSYNTFLRIIDETGTKPISYKTKRRLMSYIHDYEDKHGRQL